MAPSLNSNGSIGPAFMSSSVKMGSALSALEMGKSAFIRIHSSRNVLLSSAFSVRTKAVWDAMNSSTTSSTHPLFSANYAPSLSASNAATSPTACNATSLLKESLTRHQASARNAESTPFSIRPSASARAVKSISAICVLVWPSARIVLRGSSWTNKISARGV